MRMNEADVSDPFPHFIIEFLTNKYLKKPMLDKNTLDILLSADFYKDKSKEIEIFVKFLTEEFDNEDLIFFLFVRSTIEKEMNMMFIEKAREEIKIQYNEDKEFIDTELYLSIKSCLKSKLYLNLIYLLLKLLKQYLVHHKRYFLIHLWRRLRRTLFLIISVKT